ncbi:unnamed protein product [Lactuca saligna]|uniref:Uncharacterized protein n=1 Tax=Lactuca saligna TaxID=75948 RepID=A0AA35ZE18_LACSI|nr:unnamed protein product [Lactuca saligna]
MEVISSYLVRFVFLLAKTVIDEGGGYQSSPELINLEEKMEDFKTKIVVLKKKVVDLNMKIVDLEPTGACGSDGGGSSVVGGGDSKGWWLVATGGNVYVFFKFEMREKIEFV